MAVIDRAAAHQGWPLRGVPLYWNSPLENFGSATVSGVIGKTLSVL